MTILRHDIRCINNANSFETYSVRPSSGLIHHDIELIVDVSRMR